MLIVNYKKKQLQLKKKLEKNSMANKKKMPTHSVGNFLLEE
jgi:hypothetical protein